MDHAISGMQLHPILITQCFRPSIWCLSIISGLLSGLYLSFPAFYMVSIYILTCLLHGVYLVPAHTCLSLTQHSGLPTTEAALKLSTLTSTQMAVSTRLAASTELAASTGLAILIINISKKIGYTNYLEKKK